MSTSERVLICVACLIAAAPVGAAQRWVSLFDGKALKGWTAEGNAIWKVENGAIFGHQGPNRAGGDLYTVREWQDFEVEAEFKLNDPANSGLWFRRTPKQRGYQVDLLDEPQHPDIIAGSIYAEGKGFLVKNGDPKTYKKNAWNRVRLVVAGDAITVMMNGKTVVQTHDSTFLGPGRIGFQVHPGNWTPNMEVRTRKIRIRDLKK